MALEEHFRPPSWRGGSTVIGTPYPYLDSHSIQSMNAAAASRNGVLAFLMVLEPPLTPGVWSAAEPQPKYLYTQVKKKDGQYKFRVKAFLAGLICPTEAVRIVDDGTGPVRYCLKTAVVRCPARDDFIAEITTDSTQNASTRWTCQSRRGRVSERVAIPQGAGAAGRLLGWRSQSRGHHVLPAAKTADLFSARNLRNVLMWWGPNKTDSAGNQSRNAAAVGGPWPSSTKNY